MHRIRIVEEQGSILLLQRGRLFAIVERRNRKFYNLHSGRREPDPLTDKGAEHAVGADWCDETKARQLFNEATARYRDLAEHMR